MTQRAGALALALALSGCASNMPLPVNAFQVLAGQWPNKVAGGAIQRNFVIKGDTIEYPSLGFSMSRPNATDWEFIAGPVSVAVALRRELAQTEPVPSFGVQFAELNAEAKPEQLLEQDIKKFLDAGAQVQQLELPNVANLPGRSYLLDFIEPTNGLRQVLNRLYFFQDRRVFIMAITAEPATYIALQDKAFTPILQSIKIKAQEAPAEAAP